MNRIEIGSVCDVFDGPHATPTKVESGPIYLGIDAITDNGKINPAGYNYLTEEDYVKWTKRVTPQYGDIVFSYEATLGKYALIPKDFYGCLGRRLAVVRPKDERINVKWLYYYFRSPEWTVFIKNNTVKGSTVDRISIENFPFYKIPLIDREEQDKIVSVLSSIDDKIDNNVKINDNLEQQLKIQYNYWFTQFDFPDKQGNPYFTSGGNMYLNNKINQYIPVGWTVSFVKDLLPVVTGKEDANFSTPDGKYNFFTCSMDTLKCDNYAFDGNAILIAGNGDFNVKHYSGKFNAYQRTYVLIPEEKYYAVIYVKASTMIQHFKTGSNGSIVKFITKGDVENIPIIIPDDNNLLLSLNQYVNAIEHNQTEIVQLIKLRDWLLPMLMNGQAAIEN